MRKILLLFVIMSAVVACGGDEGVLGPGSGNPLSECAVPDTVRAGGELILQWNGFEDDAALSLHSESEGDYELEVEVVTSSGLIAVVPVDVPPGEYDVMLVQGGSRKLGTVRVTAAPEVPDSGDDPEPEPEPEPEPDPDPDPEPDPDPDPGLDPEPGPGTDPDDPSGKKRLSRVEYYAPYLGTSRIMMSWDISIEDPVTMTVSESLVEGAEVTVQRYDRYVALTSVVFELLEDGFEASDNMSMEYVRGADGSVVSTKVSRYNGKTPSFTWNYADGYLTDISVPESAKCSLEYQSGNLTSFQYAVFEYGNPALVNNPDAADVVWGYMSLTNYAVADPFIFFPYLLGWYHPASSQLPTLMHLPDPSGSGTIPCELSYTFDQEGYVTCMSWKQDNQPYDLKFIYASEN